MNRYQQKYGLCRLSIDTLLILFLSWQPLVVADQGDGLPTVSVSVLQFGTAHWELNHIVDRQLDRRHGYTLALRPVANLPASHLAVTSGTVNGAVADLLWAQSRYQAGSAFLYVPFSSSIGDIVVAEESPVRTVSDLEGLRIGVAGGPDSKGWILLQKVAAQQGINLIKVAEVQYAAPPLLSQALRRGQIDAIVTYWHFAARLKGEGGWRSAFGMADLLTDMELASDLPVLGYVFPEPWVRDNPQLLESFARSVAEAKAELAEQPVYWRRLRPLMRTADKGVFEALRAGFIAGNPQPLTDQRIADLRELLVLTGVESNTLMPDTLFYRGQP
ncbi:ABC transporter substrate-binding protein [Marinobacter sp. M216]|uniref:ABC transporter substrate-binding protein n=1 Tax=Marinobacter albus TaxID=3030833 RepID=A0ABT7H823_9GAMM|nr:MULTISPECIES: ABC transporter substrate-binding protein [unclassified Marinobacter]MBW7471224.1 ABC transporter substrate-binding protein [Marinobacter sp. F4218]MDK9556500.1 ABC transporter substrate-binding protein [Marinobacter sp. M216]